MPHQEFWTIYTDAMNKEREQQTSWDLSPLFLGDSDPSMEQWEEEAQQQSLFFVSRWKNTTVYLSEASVLQKALKDYEQWLSLYEGYGKLSYYWGLRSSQDATSSEVKAKETQVQQKAAALRNEMQFFFISLAKVSESTQQTFLNAPELKPYRSILRQLFAEGKYLLSEQEERILNLKAIPSYGKWVSMVSDFFAKEEREVKGQEGKKTFESIMSLLQSKEKEVRASAAEVSYEIMEKHADIAEVELNAVLLNKKIDDDLRNIPRPDLSRHLGDDMESHVVDTLIETVSSRFDISKRFYKLKARLLGEEKIAYHDKSAEYGDLPPISSFKDASNIVELSLGELDPEFGEIFRRFLLKGQIDVFPQKGKRGGAFCASGLISHPTYILMNYTGTIRDVETLAHEVGHGIHNELMRKSGNALSFGSSLAVAEVASTFFESFALDHIEKNLQEKQRLALLMTQLHGDISTIFRQVACYKLETDLHKTFREKGHISKEEIGELFVKHMSSYLGESVFFPPRAEYGWTYWRHIRAFFYVYSYASGLLIAKALRGRVRRNPKDIEQVKSVLSVGLSASPREMFADIGIDIAKKEFWDEGIAEIERMLKEAESLAETIGR